MSLLTKGIWMRKILGSLFLAILAFGDFKITLNKTVLFVKEPLVLKLQFQDKEYEKIAWVKFAPKRAKEYEFHLLKKQINRGLYTFTYLLFPLKDGQIHISYNLQYKKAALEQIRQDILGTGYEQTEPLEGKVVELHPPSSQIIVNPVKKVELYGDFTLTLQVDKEKVKNYEPLFLTIKLQGVGYPPKLDEKLLSLDSVKILADKPRTTLVYTPKGAKVEYLFSYALIAHKDFTIPAIKLTQFNYKEYKTITTSPIPIKVTSTMLVDSKNDPAKLIPLIKQIGEFLGYVAIFVLGGATALLLYLFVRNKEIEDIILARDSKQLLTILVLRYPRCFKDIKKMLQTDPKLLKAKWIVLKGLKRCKRLRS